MEKIAFLLIGWLSKVFSNLRRIRVTVHDAYFETNIQAYFINVTNLSKSKEIEITHVWFDCSPIVDVLNVDRPLPKRLKPDETWETWIKFSDLPKSVHKNPYTLARIRLSTTKVYKSIENKNVPPVGMVPGGPITET